MKKVFYLLALCLSLVFSGCSQQQDAQVASTDQTEVVQVETESDQALPGDEYQRSRPDTRVARTSMIIRGGVKREYQNGPSEEEMEKYRRLVERKSAPRKTYRPEQTNDPVFDGEMVKVGQ